MRLIDADELSQKDFTIFWNDVFDEKVFKSIIKKAPTVDIKTNDEEVERLVERLTKILNSYTLEYGTVNDKQKVIDEARREVARGIFAELEKLMLDGTIGNVYKAKVINPDKYAELKNKYIGGAE